MERCCSEQAVGGKPRLSYCAGGATASYCAGGRRPLTTPLTWCGGVDAPLATKAAAERLLPARLCLPSRPEGFLHGLPAV